MCTVDVDKFNTTGCIVFLFLLPCVLFNLPNVHVSFHGHVFLPVLRLAGHRFRARSGGFMDQAEVGPTEANGDSEWWR